MAATAQPLAFSAAMSGRCTSTISLQLVGFGAGTDRSGKVAAECLSPVVQPPPWIQMSKGAGRDAVAGK